LRALLRSSRGALQAADGASTARPGAAPTHSSNPTAILVLVFIPSTTGRRRNGYAYAGSGEKRRLA
jgi:hypothetical protein